MSLPTTFAASPQEPAAPYDPQQARLSQFRAAALANLVGSSSTWTGLLERFCHSFGASSAVVSDLKGLLLETAELEATSDAPGSLDVAAAHLATTIEQAALASGTPLSLTFAYGSVLASTLVISAGEGRDVAITLRGPSPVEPALADPVLGRDRPWDAFLRWTLSSSGLAAGWIVDARGLVMASQGGSDPWADEALCARAALTLDAAERVHLAPGGLRAVYVRYPTHWLTLLRARRSALRSATVVLKGTSPIGPAAARDIRRVLRALVEVPLVNEA